MLSRIQISLIGDRDIQQCTVGGWVDVQFLAGDDCGDKGQHNVESFLRDVLMQMLC